MSESNSVSSARQVLRCPAKRGYRQSRRAQKAGVGSEGLKPCLVGEEGVGAVQEVNTGDRGLEVSGRAFRNTKCPRPATAGIPLCVYVCRMH